MNKDLLERYAAATDVVMENYKRLPEEMQEILKATTDLERKTRVMENMATLIKRDAALHTDSIKDWYTAMFSGEFYDELGEEIDPNATFTGLVTNGAAHIYEYLGVHDSVVRERVYYKLCDLNGWNK